MIFFFGFSLVFNWFFFGFSLVRRAKGSGRAPAGRVRGQNRFLLLGWLIDFESVCGSPTTTTKPPNRAWDLRAVWTLFLGRFSFGGWVGLAPSGALAAPRLAFWLPALHCRPVCVRLWHAAPWLPAPLPAPLPLHARFGQSSAVSPIEFGCFAFGPSEKCDWRVRPRTPPGGVVSSPFEAFSAAYARPFAGLGVRCSLLFLALAGKKIGALVCCSWLIEWLISSHLFIIAFSLLHSRFGFKFFIFIEVSLGFLFFFLFAVTHRLC